MGKSNDENNRDYAKQYEQIRGHKQNESRSQSKYNANSNSNKGGSSCFPAGTMILTPHGERDIAMLSSGDLVVSNVGVNARSQRILKRVAHTQTPLWVVTFTDGTVIRTTAAHSFLTASGWKRAAKLGPNDSVSVALHDAMNAKSVLRSCASQEQEDVYNLIVENDFTFVAHGAIVHSFSYARELRMFLWTTIRSMTRTFARAILIMNRRPSPTL